MTACLMAGCSSIIIAAIRWLIAFWESRMMCRRRGAGITSFLLLASPGSWFIASRVVRLTHFPGEKRSYASWADQHRKLSQMLFGCSRIAMQYSPNCAIPYISLVDAGTVELVRSAGVEIVSSADLVQEFEARWTEKQYRQHVAAGKLVDQARREAFQFIGRRLRVHESVTEYEVQQFIRDRFASSGLITDHGPIVGVNANASDPHYEPSREKCSHIKVGDLVLIDLWAKLAEPDAVFYDVTWTGFCGTIRARPGREMCSRSCETPAKRLPTS